MRLAFVFFCEIIGINTIAYNKMHEYIVLSAKK